jgi:hypothetical protein
MSLKKKLIVILGSKPGADIPLGDAVYCANAAIGYYADMVSRFPRVVSVLSPDSIHPKERRTGAVNRDMNVRQWEMIITSRPDRMILTRAGHFEFLKEVLDEAGFRSPVESVSAFIGDSLSAESAVVTIRLSQAIFSGCCWTEKSDMPDR